LERSARWDLGGSFSPGPEDDWAKRSQTKKPGRWESTKKHGEESKRKGEFTYGSEGGGRAFVRTRTDPRMKTKYRD